VVERLVSFSENWWENALDPAYHKKPAMNITENNKIQITVAEVYDAIESYLGITIPVDAAMTLTTDGATGSDLVEIIPSNA
jgi:hypothetical protein